MKALTVARKEIADQMNSNKFLIVFGLLLLLTAATAFQGAQSYQDSMDRFQESQNSDSQYGFAPEKPSVLDAFTTLTQGVNFPLIGGLLALLLSFNTVSGERDKNTLKLLTSYPLHRDSIITGKFMAGIFTLTIASAASFMVASAVIIGMTGAAVTGVAASRILLMLGGTVIYMSCIFGLGALLSTVFNDSSTALTGGILVLVLSTLVVPQMAFMLSDVLVEESEGNDITVGEGSTGLSESYKERMQIRNTITKLAPSGSYGNFMSYMLGQDPSSVGISTGGSEAENEPSVMESLNSSLGNLGLLAGQTVLFFGASFVLFTRQEI
ncbi:ABC transporter permease [Candidatus Nanohalobium constans]|uniref:ABC-2 type transport system permease protein n=1 Tax=Candidatus Nanohalobium constans TaxID=2565781 RepID=A0A5Q0UG67_9ARCH|nr:ABC transporter permease [Candidatus Nanohalobium constans]QGA80597.1 ABC-2 type transport system permease protein [Candidatus Nanohalobium constans]